MIPQVQPLGDPEENAVRIALLSKLESDPGHYLAEYTRRFGNVLNADNAATLFGEYNENPAKYRVAAHPAAQWIRDELFRLSLLVSALPERNRIVFTSGGNAAGKTCALTFANAMQTAHVVFDSTLTNPDYARRLIERVLESSKAVSILYVNRPLDDALEGMIERCRDEGRVVTIHQIIESQRLAATTVRRLWNTFRQDPRVAFTFLANSSQETREAGVETAIPQDYTESRLKLNELLHAAYNAKRISEANYLRIRGS
jgi:hypothetical protein